MKIGLFFGSFNPVHTGHMIIANYMLGHSDLDQLWFMISPQSPFKKEHTLADEDVRLLMVQLAIGDHKNLKASDFEFQLKKPSYTINTLEKLKEHFPKDEFVLVMGSDNLTHFDKWKRYEEILDNYEIYVYLRPDFIEEPFITHDNVYTFDAPLLDISASYIRNELAEGRSAKYLIPDPVHEFLKSEKLYHPKT